MDRRAAAAALEEHIGYAFVDRGLLERALTHASAGQGLSAASHNETLEFLGDRVLGLLAAEALASANPQWREGELSRRHAALVSGRRCAQVARALDLGPALRLAGGTSRQGGRENDRILGDAMEALLAAVYLDGGIESARALFNSAWRESLADLLREHVADGKTDLQEWAMARGLALPAYHLTARSGPQHNPLFTVEVTVEGFEPARGGGATLKAAQTAAAQALLQRERAGA